MLSLLFILWTRIDLGVKEQLDIAHRLYLNKSEGIFLIQDEEK